MILINRNELINRYANFKMLKLHSVDLYSEYDGLKRIFEKLILHITVNSKILFYSLEKMKLIS